MFKNCYNCLDADILVFYTILCSGRVKRPLHINLNHPKRQATEAITICTRTPHPSLPIPLPIPLSLTHTKLL